MIIVVMGVSGSGKTTVGRRLADALGWPFVEGDDFHPPANVAKMRRGEPLTDADREPWLRALAEEMRRLDAQGQSAVLASSALKARYREVLRPQGVTVQVVYLEGEMARIRQRLETREGHYMPAGLLESQFAALEPPQDALAVDAHQSPDAIVQQILAALDLPPA